MALEQTYKTQSRNDLLQSNLQITKQLLFYDKMFNNINAIIMVFDMNQLRLIWVNDYFHKMMGIRKNKKPSSPEQVLDMYHPDDRDFLPQMKKFFETHKKGNYTALYKFKNARDEYVWFYTSANVFRNVPEESVFEVVAVSVDFSKQITYHKNVKTFSKDQLQGLNQKDIGRITRREQQIVKYFANGYNTREIAGLLGLSFHTVNNHRKNVLKKLGLKNLAAMVNFAVENGLD